MKTVWVGDSTVSCPPDTHINAASTKSAAALPGFIEMPIKLQTLPNQLDPSGLDYRQTSVKNRAVRPSAQCVLLQGNQASSDPVRLASDLQVHITLIGERATLAVWTSLRFGNQRLARHLRHAKLATCSRDIWWVCAPRNSSR